MLSCAYARACYRDFDFFAVTSVTRVPKKGGLSLKIKYWKEHLSMMFGMKWDHLKTLIFEICTR